MIPPQFVLYNFLSSVKRNDKVTFLANFSKHHSKTLNCMTGIYGDVYNHNKNVLRKEIQLTIQFRKAINTYHITLPKILH